MTLRFLERDLPGGMQGKRAVVRTLQQLFSYPDGSVEWRNVPIVQLQVPNAPAR